jgi:excinuclease ABC subunit B
MLNMLKKEEREFKLHSSYEPQGDQPEAIEKLVDGLKRGDRFQTLLGVTGSGKTFTMANVIAQVQRPTLIIAHNKTLTAQLAQEFREYFPENSVEYFVSYYDYYQPEAYVPHKDLYIEKDSDVNLEINRLRHAATRALLSRTDVIIVASVSCIYGLGSPEDYAKISISLSVGQDVERRELLRRLIDMQFLRNDVSLERGTFRMKGDTLELHPPDEDMQIRISFFGNEIESICQIHNVTGEVLNILDNITIFPASHYVVLPERQELVIENISKELEERLIYYEKNEKHLERQRILERTNYDIEMIQEMGYCSGIENYSRHFSGRRPGETPSTLVEYFPKDFLLFIDESHVTVGQIGGMYKGDLSRKQNLVDYGFRLPSALDNRPLRFEEFEKYINQCIFVSATPAKYEMEHASQIVDQVVRPTGLVDPAVIIRPVDNQVDDLMEEIRKRVEKNERVLATTLTKRMAEDLSEYLTRLGMRVKYLHSDVDTIDRIKILRDLRLGEFDVLIGINLLREGLDLPEVSLVAILDADKAGFLRSETSLIQTMGRAARHIHGMVILYANQTTKAIESAVRETNRRREKQMEYNEEHGITPQSIVKPIKDIAAQLEFDSEDDERIINFEGIDLKPDEVPGIIDALRSEMFEKAKDLDFEKAAKLRDEIKQLEDMLTEKASQPGKRGRRKKRRGGKHRARQKL